MFYREKIQNIDDRLNKLGLLVEGNVCLHTPENLFEGKPLFNLTYTPKDGKMKNVEVSLCSKCKCLYIADNK